MTDDDTLTPMEVFVCGHALQHMLEQFGDDAVVESARAKLDRAFQRAQQHDPTLADQIKAHQRMMEAGKEIERADRIEEKLASRGLRSRWGRRSPPNDDYRRVNEDPDDLGYAL